MGSRGKVSTTAGGAEAGCQVPTHSCRWACTGAKLQQGQVYHPAGYRTLTLHSRGQDRRVCRGHGVLPVGRPEESFQRGALWEAH